MVSSHWRSTIAARVIEEQRDHLTQLDAASGDCPAGCMSHAESVFTTTPGGAITPLVVVAPRYGF